MLDTLALQYESPSTGVYSCGNVLLIVGRDTPTVEDLHRVSDHGEALTTQWKSGVGVALCVAAGARPPGGEVRDLSTSVYRQLSKNALALGTAVLGEGFGAAAARSVLSLMIMAARPAAPARVFGGLSPMLDWVLERTDGKDGLRFDRVRVAEAVRLVLAPPE